MGQEKFWEFDNFSSSVELEPGQETGYRLEVFRIVSKKPIDEIECSVIFEYNKEKKKVSSKIPVKQHESKNEYTFPLKGEWLVWGNWDNTAGHRTMYSQEFAFDLIQYNDDLMLPQTGSTPNEHFKMYKKDILAIADGEVIECFSKSPENPSAPEMLSNEERREITEKYGLVAMASGNYAIIKHQHNEYSYYAHMATDSVTVKKGDKVKQGQVIGKLGNSGNSTGPHLHFQLMDGPSILTGRGLPCHFTNIIDFTGVKITLIQNSLTVVHTIDNQK
ncbi:MAG: M23 family metallopeptidase [Asgard group archaeon]|nr:M23 family metallopeptidase [Asgard group archaeon]